MNFRWNFHFPDSLYIYMKKHTKTYMYVSPLFGDILKNIQRHVTVQQSRSIHGYMSLFIAWNVYIRIQVRYDKYYNMTLCVFPKVGACLPASASKRCTQHFYYKVHKDIRETNLRRHALYSMSSIRPPLTL